MRSKKQYELVFAGEANTLPEYRIPRHCRLHKTLESAQATARLVFEQMEARGLGPVINGHSAIIYGPGLGNDGQCVPR